MVHFEDLLWYNRCHLGGTVKEKPGRNDPCFCGSGKKFKKCCESSSLGGRFRATPLGSESRISNLATLFQRISPATPSPQKEEGKFNFSAVVQNNSR